MRTGSTCHRTRGAPSRSASPSPRWPSKSAAPGFRSAAERKPGAAGLLGQRGLGDADGLGAPRVLWQVEPVRIHYLGPGVDEVANELLLNAFLGIDLRDRPELAIRAEDQVGPSCAPLLMAAAAVIADKFLVAALVDNLPEGVVVEQVDEEIV